MLIAITLFAIAAAAGRGGRAMPGAYCNTSGRMSRIIHTGCPYAPFLKFALICMTLNPVHQPFNMAACLPVQRHELILVAPGIPPAEVLPEHLRNMVAVNV
jgi:hypothetical protein